MTVRAETQIDLTRVDDGTPGTPGANGATFTPSVSAAGDISWTNDGGLPNPATQNIKGPAGNTPYIQGGYWYINGTSTGVKAEGDDGTTSVWYYGNKITGTSTTPTVFSGSGIANAVVGDMYLNTDNSNVYQCTLGGNASTAKWVYAGTIADGIITVKSVNGSIASFSDASEYPALEVITDINAKQAGSGTPSPSNPRAISGYSTIGTYATGTNLLENNVTSQTATVTDTFTIVRNDDGSLTFNGTATGTRVLIGNLATNFVGTSAGQNDGKKHIPNGTWKMTTHCSNAGIRLQVIGTNNPTGTASVTSISTSADTNITIDDTYAYNWVRINITSGTYSNVTIYPTIAPKTDYVYTPFGNSYATPLPSTVYGGTLDVTKGLLTVTHGIIDLSTLSWTYSSNYSTTGRATFYASLSGSVGKPNAQIADCTAEKYATASVSSVTTTSGGKIGIASNATPPRVWCSTLDQSDTPSGNLVYELATPQTYNVSPQQIQLLQGTNNVWTDSGDVDLKYAIISAGAVEALREPIDNASKVATSYITQIDEGGIKVHDAGDTTNYAKLDSNGMQVYQGNTEVASFGANEVELGKNGLASTIKMCGARGVIYATQSGALDNLWLRTATPTSRNSSLLLDARSQNSSNYGRTATLELKTNSSNYDGETELRVDLHSVNGSYSNLFMSNYARMLYSSSIYSNNEAQFGVSANDVLIWMGIGAGGTNHGLYSEDESAWIVMSDGTYNYTGNSFGPNVTSSGSDGYYLGWSTKRWRGVYSYNAPNSVSDKKHKDIIGDIDFAKDLIMNLKPVEYQWKESDHKRTHMGLIAQDSAEVAKELGKDLSFYEAQYIDGSDYHGEETDDANLNWGMMYTELIAPLIKVVQEQQHEIDELKERIDALERK